MIKKKLILLFGIIILTSGCSNFALLASGGSFAISQNSYTKIYNALDFLTVITTEKSIKEQIYDKGKKHVQALTRFTNH
jgi:hypothetical protein